MPRTGRPPNKGSIKKGEIRNPTGKGGHHPMSDDEREATKLTKVQILEVLSRMMVVREDDCKRLLTDPNTPMFHKAVAKLFQLALKNGCERKLEFILNRLIGKVTDKVEHSGALQPFVIEYSDGKRVEMGVKREEE